LGELVTLELLNNLHWLVVVHTYLGVWSYFIPDHQMTAIGHVSQGVSDL
jgi:hypothetical protein